MGGKWEKSRRVRSYWRRNMSLFYKNFWGDLYIRSFLAPILLPLLPGGKAKDFALSGKLVPRRIKRRLGHLALTPVEVDCPHDFERRVLLQKCNLLHSQPLFFGQAAKCIEFQIRLAGRKCRSLKEMAMGGCRTNGMHQYGKRRAGLAIH